MQAIFTALCRREKRRRRIGIVRERECEIEIEREIVKVRKEGVRRR